MKKIEYITVCYSKGSNAWVPTQRYLLTYVL